jgi:hypothetical protein
MVERDDLSDLHRLLQALAPFLDRLVIIGGWAHRLYRFDDIIIPSYDPIYTTDTDVALARDAAGSNAILESLREHGFVEEFRGEDRPPITHYHLGDASSDYYVEFLTPFRRRRQREDTVDIGGVIAQALPRLDVVMMEPWSIRVPGADGFLVRVANPVSYIAQKLLVMKDRLAQDRAKDVLYIHDTLELYGGRLEELHRLWRERIGPDIGKDADVVVSCARNYFDEVTDDIRRGTLVAGGRDLDAEMLRVRCQVALEQIFDYGFKKLSRSSQSAESPDGASRRR